MARLNEPAATIESIDSLKRKFMRQNRDIARANSTQSLRIRNLENETSRLLAENLDLREQILRLQNELENGQSQRIANQTGVIKAQLESKLVELGALVTGLGEEPVRKKKLPQGGKITRASPSQSPDQRNWKNMCTLSDAVAGQEGRLPPIQENKTYPRRTLERQEIIDIAADGAIDTTDSPEIGPPPVSQFVDEDPVKIDLPSRTRKQDSEEPSGLDPALSINLEQRRKRKDTIGASESRRASRFEPANGNVEGVGSFKTGAKRKLSVREDEETTETTTKLRDASPDDFKFTRVATEDKTRNRPISQSERSSKVTRDLAVARGAPRDRISNTAAVPANRKVLAPKSVNDSPRKAAKAPIQDEVKAAKNEMSKSNSTRERTREKKPETFVVKTSNDPMVNTVEIQPEPETPAAPDLFSPSSSQPSTARAESRDTPPPPDLGPGTEGQRPNRRARGSVSYAEPNLRDKMRRPTKELVDAVSREDKAHRASFVKIEEDGGTSTVKIKAEPESDDAWKRMPNASSAAVENSPLSSKAPPPEILPSSITTHRKRRESLLKQIDAELPKSGSASAIAAMLSESRKAKAAAREREKAVENEAAVTKAMEKLDIYEFRGSSPLPPEETTTKPSKEERAPSRFTRRHSSISRDAASFDDSEASDLENSKKPESSTTRRRQSSLGLRSSSSGTEPAKEAVGEQILKKASSTIGMADEAANGSRSDRMSARRRSMML